MTHEHRKTVQFRLDREVHRALKAECARRDLSIQTAVSALVERWVHDRRHGRGDGERSVQAP
jgi:predicted HicB family RNase H-like nuclease